MKTSVHFLRQRVFRPTFASLITVGLLAFTTSPAPGGAPGALPTPFFIATDFFPPPGTFEMGDIHFPSGAMLTNMRVELPSGPRESLPPPGVSRTVSIDDALWYLHYRDAAGTVTPLALPASLVLRVTGAPPGGTAFSTSKSSHSR
jgi:hypothetical protein